MTPEAAYQQQAYNARQRGISFELTFEQWWDIWEKWFHMRGRGKNMLCMARIGDEGPYALGNVYLTTNLGNALDTKRVGKKLSDDERIARQSKKERWQKSNRASSNDRVSHLSYKAHCRDTDENAIDRDSEVMAE